MHHANAEAYIRRMPKVELHVHLEGAVRPPRLLQIFRRHGLHSHLRTPADVAFLFEHASVAEFLDHFRFVVTSFRDVEDVHAVAADLFRELAVQNVVYAEVLFSAGVFARAGMPWGELLEAVSTAAPEAPRYGLVVDLVRNFGPQFALEQVETLARLGHPRVVGVHLGGDEVGYSAEIFAAAYEAARAAGLGCAAHAGEAAGPASIRAAVDALQVTRIGHGIRCLEDPELVSLLVERGTTLEVCPTSNVRTHVVADLAAHPLPQLLRRGLRVTLGADDPSYFDTDLTRELQAVHEVLGLGLETLDTLTDQGMLAAFVPDASQRLEAIRHERLELRRELGL